MSKPINPKFAPTDLQHHLGHEVEMLRETYKLVNEINDLLKATPDQRRVLRNAMIETFCIHARGLEEFFRKDCSGSAKSYASKYDPAKIDKKLKDKLNMQLAHLIHGRAAGEEVNNTDRYDLLKFIEEELAKFQGLLDHPFDSIQITAIPVPLPPLLTDPISTTTTGEKGYVSNFGAFPNSIPVRGQTPGGSDS
jgi:hypothetical protein